MFILNDSNQCSSTCSGYSTTDNVCYSSCPSTGEKYIQVNEKKCRSDCGDNYIPESGVQCVDSCTHFISEDNSSCEASCKYLHLDGVHCSASCSDNFISVDSYHCINSCDNWYLAETGN